MKNKTEKFFKYNTSRVIMSFADRAKKFMTGTLVLITDIN